MIGRPKFVLASGSPRRLALINQAGIEPDALKPADIDESPRRGEIPRAHANRLARSKAEVALANVRLDDYFLSAVTRTEVAWRQVIALAVANGVPTPAFSSSLAYYDGLRRARGPANLLQGLRDYFGAHTYRRLDKEGSFHTRWSQDGSEVKV